MAVGLLIFSAGGITLLQIAEASNEPRNKLFWHAVLVFWVIFMLKTVISVAWQGTSKEAAAAPPTVANESEDEDVGAATGIARRRRPQRA